MFYIANSSKYKRHFRGHIYGEVYSIDRFDCVCVIKRVNWKSKMVKMEVKKCAPSPFFDHHDKMILMSKTSKKLKSVMRRRGRREEGVNSQ